MESKIARNALHCDHKDCDLPCHIIVKGEEYAVGEHGELFCVKCAERPILETQLAGALA